MTKETNNKDSEYNVFRDSLLRYAGYANEVGESFRYQFPGLVLPSYVISFGYCLADAGNTGWNTWNSINNRSNKRIQDTVIATIDVLVWQSLASVMVPGATINLIVRASRAAVRKSPFLLPAMIQNWLPTVTGLGSIPLIVKPIDHSVDIVLDNSLRRWYPGKV